jgi:glyoxylase-like metal-dependent hydrolase (beta-lactamase superfamily II)
MNSKPSSKHSFNGMSAKSTRAAFLARISMGILGSLAMAGPGLGAESVANPGLKRKGQPDARVKSWDILTIGNLSRNRYWGESDARGVRSAICTCTLIQGEGFRTLVDPSLSNVDDMARELDRRTGLKPRDVDAVFVTHDHGDHFAGLAHFRGARWLAGAEVAAVLNQSGKFSKSVEVAGVRLFEAIEVVHTPGHTMSHRSLRFDCRGLSVVVAGDAVATQDFWWERRGYYNCIDFELSAKTMDHINDLADLVVPGHDNYFLVQR